MAKIKYIEKNFREKSILMIETANAIITEFHAQGFDLTLRQLYYQFVARDLIANTQKEYDNLGCLINDARLAGMIDWNAIVDRTRNVRQNSHWTSPGAIIEACSKQYQIDKWEGQAYRPEVWIEKDALVGVIEQICRKLDVPFFSCRGYTSQSEMFAAAQRLIEHDSDGAIPVIIHLGDHDPSGLDMSRDIEDRLALFCRTPIEVRRIALNRDQIRKYSPPPNPAKLTDCRAKGYVLEHGASSWELDALDPKVITRLISNELDELRDDAKFEERLDLENEHKHKLKTVAKKLAD